MTNGLEGSVQEGIEDKSEHIILPLYNCKVFSHHIYGMHLKNGFSRKDSVKDGRDDLKSGMISLHRLRLFSLEKGTTESYKVMMCPKESMVCSSPVTTSVVNNTR